jgi:hypothetical protein
LLENEAFKNNFINRFADLLNTAFVPDNLIPIVDSLEQMLVDDMPKQIDRWGSTMGNWEIGIEGVRNYLHNRSGYVWEHIRDKFNLEQPNQLDLRVIPEGAGRIEVNFVTIKQFPWSGKYFEEIPITIKAIPNVGHQFYGWNDMHGASPEMTLNLEEDQVLTAYFSVSQEVKELIINEINYNSAQSLETGDWIEIYNPNPWEVSLDGYSLKDGDEDHQYIINDDYTIAPYGYFVFAQDTNLMKGFFPGLMTLAGNFDFGYNSNGESVRLYNESGWLIDSVRYQNVPPWPPAADGTGATLELIEHNPENEDPWNWQASYIAGGTPGLVNSNPGSAISNPGESVSDITVYPNPGNGIYYLEFNNPRNGEYQIKILNMVGETVNGIKGQKLPKSERVVIDLTNQPEGIYFIQVFFNGKMETVKLIKTG